MPRDKNPVTPRVRPPARRQAPVGAHGKASSGLRGCNRMGVDEHSHDFAISRSRYPGAGVREEIVLTRTIGQFSYAVPAKSRDPPPRACNVLRLSPREQTTRDPVHRVNSDLLRRVWEHKVKAIPGFTAQYGVDQLVWFERHDNLAAAMQREKRIKSWKRGWKIELKSVLDRSLPQHILRALRWVPAFRRDSG